MNKAVYWLLLPTILGPEAYRNYIEGHSTMVDFQDCLAQESLLLCDELLRDEPDLRMEIRAFRANYSRSRQEVELGVSCTLRDRYGTVLGRSAAVATKPGNAEHADAPVMAAVQETIEGMLRDLQVRSEDIQRSQAVSAMVEEDLDSMLTADAERYYRQWFGSSPPEPSTPSGVDAFSADRTKCVIVGVSDYKDPRLQLRFARSDALKLYRALVDPANKMAMRPGNVALLLDERATAANVRAALNRFLGAEQKVDVIIYWSGHGGIDEDRTGESPDGMEKYLLTTDSSTQDDFHKTAVSMDEVAGYLASKSFSRVLIVLDTCYSGSTGEKGYNRLRGARGVAGVVDPTRGVYDAMRSTSCKALLAACKSNQLAHEVPEFKAGLLTHYVVEALRAAHADRNNDSYVTVGELLSYVPDMVPKKAEEMGFRQDPIVRVPEATSLEVAITSVPGG